MFGCLCFTLSLTRRSVIDWGSTAGHDRRDAGRGDPRRHVQQRLDDVALEDGVLLPQVQHSHYFTLETDKDETETVTRQ